MDLNYSKWDRVVEEDTSGSEGEGAGGGRHRGPPSSSSAAAGCDDPTCCSCSPDNTLSELVMSRMMNSSSMASSSSSGMADVPPEAMRMFSTMMASGAPGFSFGPGVSPAMFAGMAAGMAGAGGGGGGGDGGGQQQRGQGPSSAGGGEDENWSEPPPLEPTSSSDEGEGAGGGGGGGAGGGGSRGGRGAGGHGAAGGDGGGGGGDDSSSSSPSDGDKTDDSELDEDEDDMEGAGSSTSEPDGSDDDDDDDDDDDESSDGGPPALASSSDGESDKGASGAASGGGTLYSEYVLAREAQPGTSASMAFWRDKKHSTSSLFTDYFVEKVVRGRPIPHVSTALALRNFPRGFPEFVCCVGQMKPDNFNEASGGDVPHGFFEFAREAASKNAKMLLSKSRSRKSKVLTRSSRDGDTSTSTSTSTSKKESGDARAGAAAAAVEEDEDGEEGGGGGSSGAMVRAMRQTFESASNQRRQANTAITALEAKTRSALKALDEALSRERARTARLLKASERALAEAKAAAKAQAVQRDAAAEVEALNGGQGGGRFSVKEALERAEALKKRANTVLVDTRYPEAVEQYTLAIKVLEVHVKPAPWADRSSGAHGDSSDASDDDDDDDEGEGEEDKEEDKEHIAAREMLLILLCNRSLAHLKWGNLGSAKADAQRAMDIDPHHIKAYFRRAAAHKQAERYREALADLRYMLRLEPPPAKGVPVSKDILDVQKMAKECEQKVRAKGFEKALQETNKKAKNAKTASEQKEAREKWDGKRQKKAKDSAKPKAMPLPLPPSKKKPSAGGAAAAAAYWDIVGETYLPPRSEVPSLKERAAWVAAECIDRAPETFVQWCEGLLSEYLLCIFERLNWVSLQTMMASGLYDEVGVISSNNQTDNWQAQDRHFRQLYAATTHDDFLRASAAAAALGGGGGAAAATMAEAGKSVKRGDGGKGRQRAGSTLVSPLVLHPHLGLMDVLENHTCFTYQARDAEEEATPRLFDFNANRSSGRAVVNRDEFFQQFNVFTEGQLTFMDWNNVVAAGGSVLAAAHPPPPGPLRDFYHTLAYRSSDIDLFLYGLDESAATEKVKQIYNAVKLANPKIYAVRSLRTVTLVSEFPYRKIQIVLRLYKTLAEVLHGFDVDACSVGFDGHTVWATNRAARSICKRYNVVDLTRRSPSYESRLFKYGKRGHALLVRGLRVDKIKDSLRKANVNSGAANFERGLAKLIAMDSCYQRFHLTNWGHYYQRWNEGLLIGYGGISETQRIHNQESSQESDYTTMFIPYGPKWNRERTRRHVMNYVSSANSWYYRLNLCDPAQAPIMPVVCGNIDMVLSTGVNTGVGEKMAYSHDEETSLMHMKHVAGDEMWHKNNPGKQGMLLTGSFHPMTNSKKDWERGLYK